MSVASANDYGEELRGVPRKPLPVIDVGPVLSGDREAIEALAVEWRGVWETIGFACIVNHGVSADLTRRMTEASKRFHDLPEATKMSIAVTRDQKG